MYALESKDYVSCCHSIYMKYYVTLHSYLFPFIVLKTIEYIILFISKDVCLVQAFAFPSSIFTLVQMKYVGLLYRIYCT